LTLTQDATPTVNEQAYAAWLATPEGQAAVAAAAGPVPPAPVAVAQVPSAPAAPVAPAAVPEPPAAAAPPLDYAQLAKEMGKLGLKVTEGPKTPAEAKPPSPKNLFTPGQIVTHQWEDPYDGASSRTGIVVATQPDEGSGASSSIAWFSGVSGPIGDQNLSGV
jgi:hypothetical protein